MLDDNIENDVINELKLYYQDKFYSWNALVKKINHLPDNSQNYVVAEDRFTVVVNLLYGFIKQTMVFPVSSEFISDDSVISIVVKQNIEEENTDKKALAIATSGSQAQPKIVLISRHNIISHCQNFVKIIPINSSSVWLNCMPLSHIAGVMIVYRCWFNNASMLLHDCFDAEKIWHDIHQYSVTHISLVPRMLSRLLDLSQSSKIPESLKFVIIGGDKISDSLYQRAISAGWPLYISYGMTEATSTIAIGKTPDKLRPLNGFEIQVNSDQILKIKGAMVVENVVKKGTRRDLFDDWFETNDRVNWNGQYISILGRNDNMIIAGGKNISPQYLESLLSESPFISDIAIGKSHNDEWGNTIIAIVCGNLDEFKKWIKNEIQSGYQPRIFIKVESVPRNLMGKIDRKAVSELIDNSI
ncbi:MAG: AMP-binding protein [Gammaproteobacteria bacterium]|nr:AMP-binding protein [Gammaproteobacteria bacterium]